MSGAASFQEAIGCNQSVTAVKKTIPRGTAIPSNPTMAQLDALPGVDTAGGFPINFSTSATDAQFIDGSTMTTMNSTVVTTDTDGFAGVLMQYEAADPATKAVNITETQQAGYQLQPVNGQNMACFDSNTGNTLSTTEINSGTAPGVTVTASKTTAVKCYLYNRELAANLTWSKNDGNGQPLGGATFSISGPSGFSTVTGILDNGPLDLDPAVGKFSYGISATLPGTYTITETAAPFGYNIDTTASRTVTVTSANSTVTVTGSPTFVNQLKTPTSVTWLKNDSSGARLGGATFTVTGDNGFTPQTVLDNSAADLDTAAGQFKINVPATYTGTLTIQETTAPTGYVLDSSTKTVTITQANASTTLAVTGAFVNATGPATTITWRKVDASSNLLGGATFNVTGPTGFTPLTVVDNGTNDQDNVAGQFQITVPGSWVGTFTITETAAPQGYVMSSTSLAPNVTAGLSGTTINAGTVTNATGTPTKVTWVKRDASTNALLPGAVFSISGTSGYTGPTTVTDNGTNDQDPVAGQLAINVPASWNGTLTITESTPPFGYLLDMTPKTVMLNAGNSGTTVAVATAFTDTAAAPRTLTWKKTDIAGGLLGGATFTVSGTNGWTTQTVADNAAGVDLDNVSGQFKINVPASYTGTLTLTETIAPFGYVLSTATPTVTLDTSTAAGAALDFGSVIDLAGTPTTVTWEKRDSVTNALLGGATFSVTGPGFTTLFVTDNTAPDLNSTAGQFSIQVPKAYTGALTIKETTAPFGYDLNLSSQLATIDTTNAGSTVAVASAFLDAPSTPRTVTWKKTDASGGLLAGATFTVTATSTTNGSFPTVTVADNSAADLDTVAGQFKIDVPASFQGTLQLAETVAPFGYVASSAKPTLTFDTSTAAGATLDFGSVVNTTDTPRTVTWKKVDAAGANLAGATFTVTATSTTNGSFPTATVEDNGPLDLDPAAGQFKINVPAAFQGTLQLAETVPPFGYVASASTPTLNFTSSTAAGAALDFGSITNTLDTPRTVTWQKTDSAGGLLAGATFTVTATSTTNGSFTAVTVADNAAGVDLDPVSGQFKINVPANFQGTLQLAETVPPFGYVASTSKPTLTFDTSTAAGATLDFGSVVNATDTPRTVTWKKTDIAGGLLGGASFTVTATSTTNGSFPTLTVADNAAGVDLDPVSGQFSIQVPASFQGTLQLAETIPPFGYVASAATPTLTFDTSTLAGQSLDFGSIVNAAGTATALTWQKTDANGGANLAGATFTVTATTTTNGSFATATVADNGPLDLDPADGHFRINVPAAFQGTLQLDETAAPFGYDLNTTPVTVDVTTTNSGTVIDMGSVTDTASTPTTLTWKKVDASGGALLAAATFEVSATTTTNGSFPTVSVEDNGPLDLDPAVGQFSINVPAAFLGTLQLQETVAPFGYDLNTTTVSRDVTTTTSGTTIDFGAVEDTASTPTTLTWKKTDVPGSLLAGATFKVEGPAGFTAITDILDNGAKDMDPADGQFQVQVPAAFTGTFTITETAAPFGYAVNTTPLATDVTAALSGTTINVGTVVDQPGTPTKLTWKKTDSSGVPVGGATFTLSGPAGFTTVTGILDNSAPDIDPAGGQFTVEVPAVLVGTYTVTETSPPDGYELNSTPISVSVTTDNSGTSVDVGSVVNQRIVSIYLQKTAEDKTGAWVGMAGSTWQILTDNAGTPGSNVTGLTYTDVAGSTGVTRVDGLLESRTYWFVETQAPAGFSLLAQPVQFSLSATGAVTLGTGSGDTVSAAAGAGAQAPWWVMSVKDVPNAILPAAGGTGDGPVMWVAGVLLVAGLGAGLVLWQRRRKAGRV